MPGSVRRLITITLLIALLPLVGAILSGQPITRLIDFPLNARAWDPPGSSSVYTLLSQLIAIAVVSGLAWLSWPRERAGKFELPAHPAHAWPRYTWLSVMLAIAMLIAIDGAALNAGLGLLTLALTLLANADTERRTGSSLISQRRGYFLLLFPVSLVAGWVIFYWLNLFVQLWTYPGATESVPFALGKSFDYATLLPALLSLRQWLGSFPRLLSWTTSGIPIGGATATSTPHEGWMLMAIASFALVASAIWPEALYPIMFAAPALLAIGLQIAGRHPTILTGIRRGDWSRPVLTTVAAMLLMALSQGFNLLVGPAWTCQLPLIGGLRLLGLPAPAWLMALPLGLLGLWLADQVTDPFKRRPQQPPFRPRFPVQIPVVDLLREKKKRPPRRP